MAPGASRGHSARHEGFLLILPVRDMCVWVVSSRGRGRHTHMMNDMAPRLGPQVFPNDIQLVCTAWAAAHSRFTPTPLGPVILARCGDLMPPLRLLARRV